MHSLLFSEISRSYCSPDVCFSLSFSFARDDFSPSAPEGSTWHTAGHRYTHSLLMPAFHQDPRCQRKSSRACQRNACLLSITVFLKKKTVIARFYLTIQSLYLTIWTFTFQFLRQKNHNCKLPRSSEFISRHCDLFH